MKNVEHILAKALMTLIISIDLSDDDDIDPDVATGILEPVAALLQDMPPDDKSAIVELFSELAEAETLPERRATALDLPGALGIL